MYIALALLAERPGSVELAQVASTEFEREVSAELLDASLRGSDRSAWPADEIADADQAVARITEAVDKADGLIDGFLAQRRYVLPLNPVPRIVSEWSRAIARYFLHKDNITDERTNPIARDYRDAMKLLQQVADGKFSLGVEDPLAPQSDGVEFVAGERTFDRDKLREF